MEERRQRIESDPEGKLAEQFFAAAFQAHPYGRPILGWPADMRFLGMDEKTTLKTWTVMETILGTVGFIFAFVLSLVF